MNLKNKKPGILILGASGGVGQAVLQILAQYSELFSSIVLLDKSDSIIRSRFIDHEKIDYTFIQKTLTEENVEKIIKKITKEYNISIVLDVTDYDTLPILSAVNKLGLSYLNCSLNDSESGSMVNFAEDMKIFTKKFNKNTHVLSMGMNPGIANHLIIKGFLEHGKPIDFIEIEYDSGFPKKDPGVPFITWSKKQFLNEAVWERTGYCGEGGEYIELKKEAIRTLKNTEEYIAPIKKMDKYPMGMTVSHDEVIAMSRILEVPGKFIYAIHPVSLGRLINSSEKGLPLKEEDIEYMDNISNPLTGSDFIGVWLNYLDKRVCYYVDVKHESVKGTNATLYLVAVGVIAGLLDFVQNPLLENGVLSVFELNNKNFLDIVSKHIPIKTYEEKLS